MAFQSTATTAKNLQDQDEVDSPPSINDNTRLSSSFKISAPSQQPVFAEEEDSESMHAKFREQQAERLDRHARQRRRSRGGSFGGEGAAVLIVGVADHIPHLCSFDPKAKNACDEDMKAALWRLLSGIMTIEWYGIMLSYGLRPTSSRSLTKVPML